MSIQYAGGTIINATFASPLGTRTELAQWIRDQLVLAGWTSVGSATDYQLTCATTAGGNLNCRVRVYDPGSGNCARLKFSNVSGTKTQTGDIFLLPTALKTWRIIANKHQFFVMTPGVSAAREFACGGVPYLPTFLQGVITEAFWGHGNSETDTSVTVRASFRTRLVLAGASTALISASVQCCNNSIWEAPVTSTSAVAGQQRLIIPTSSDIASGGGYRWHDNTYQIMEALIAWGQTIGGDESKIRGQLWDSVVVSDSGAFSGDTPVTIDGRTFLAITNLNVANSASYTGGTLFVAIT